jgi:hypothetical protein
MRLRHLMRHVRTQNWVAVGLDLVIVVVGVFIGIQVSNWNDARRDLTREQVYLARLDAEMDVILERLGTGADVYRESAEATQLLLQRPQDSSRHRNPDRCQAIRKSGTRSAY